MKRILIGLFTLISVMLVTFCLQVYARSLTNQQINMILQNDDIHIVTLQSSVKKATISIKASSDNSQIKTIVEYDRNGLLINYYSTSVIKVKTPEQNTMITTLMRLKAGEWQYKQTIGNYIIGQSEYQLKNNRVTINLLPTNDELTCRVVAEQENASNDRGYKIVYQYVQDTKPENEDLKITYQFSPQGHLTDFYIIRTDLSQYNYSSIIETKFNYDDKGQLVTANESSRLQFMDSKGDVVNTTVIYSDFDKLGNWQTKTARTESETIVYQRVLEYWS